LASLIYQADQALRRVISNKMAEAKGKCNNINMDELVNLVL
jgi:hypothetical protein